MLIVRKGVNNKDCCCWTGKTYTLCDSCCEGKQTTESLKRELQKERQQSSHWQECYETALKELSHCVIMNEVVMVPAEEFHRLSNYYQGKITESALLNKAGRLAAQQQLILEDKSIPDSLAVRMVKLMALEQSQLLKRVRTGMAQPASYEGTEEPKGMADAPMERLLKDLVKKQAPKVIEIESPKKPTVKKKLKKVAIKKKWYSPRPKPKPTTSGYKTPESQIIRPT